MKLLFDQNLPRSLVNRFEDSFPGSSILKANLRISLSSMVYQLKVRRKDGCWFPQLE